MNRDPDHVRELLMAFTLGIVLTLVVWFFVTLYMILAPRGGGAWGNRSALGWVCPASAEPATFGAGRHGPAAVSPASPSPAGGAESGAGQAVYFALDDFGVSTVRVWPQHAPALSFRVSLDPSNLPLKAGFGGRAAA